jgi:hypothetical protein
MKLQKTPIAAAIALAAAWAPGAQANPITVEAESMSLSSYKVENGTRIMLTASSGTATKSFSGAAGTYDIAVTVYAEDDGQSTLELYNGATKLHTYKYPKQNGTVSYAVKGVALKSGDTIKVRGVKDGGAWARVDRLVFTPVSTSTSSGSTSTTSGSTTTIEAESMSRSSYAVEDAKRIKLTAASGSAWKTFSGASGTYNAEVTVLAESDGKPTLEFYKNSTRLHTYTYPQVNETRTYTISNVALNNGDTIKLLGRANGGAWARVDKIVLKPASTTTPTTSEPAPTTSTAACANPSGGYEGFGKNTTGGAGKTIYKVTNLKDSGTGSLRDALSKGSRCVVFTVGGTINLSSNLLVKGANVTVDGLTAPSPGITLKGATLVVQGSSGANNVVLRGIRHRYTPSGADAIRLYNTYNVVVDRVSVTGFGDGAVDVTEKSRDVTIQWSILGDGVATHSFPSLLKYDTSRVTVHHNLYVKGRNRNPHCARNDSASSLPSELVCDVRNNLIWDYGDRATEVRKYGKANVVNNYYYTTKGTSASMSMFIAEGGSAYVKGNVSGNGLDLDSRGNRSTPYSAVVPTTTDARTAAKEVLAKAGARGPRFGLDSKDQGFVNNITIK